MGTNQPETVVQAGPRPVHLALVERGFGLSPQQAGAWVMEGLVEVNSHPVRDPYCLVRPGDDVTIADWALPAVVRPVQHVD